MLRSAFVLFSLAGACHEPASTVDTALATQRLCNHIAGSRKRMIVNPIGSETVWSDGALMERATDFPAPLRALIDKPTETRDMLALLQSIDSRNSEWHAADLRRTGEGDFACEVTDGTIKAPVHCVYTSYLQARYPTGKVRLLAAVEPILFVVDGRLKAVLMPVKP